MATAAADWTGMNATHEGEERLSFLYRTHGEDLRAYCRRRLGWDEAEDALAEVFAIAWRRLESVPSGHEARLWLYGVARNVIRNSTRSTRRRSRLTSRLTGSSNPPTPDPAETMLTRSEHQHVLAALAALRPMDQELLRLHAWEELSRDEIAQVLGISIPAVDMRLHRAVARLSRALESRGFDGHSTSGAQDRGGMP